MSKNKPTLKRNRTKQIDLSKFSWFNFLTLLLGITALYFSWQANQLASSQSRSNPVVLSEKNVGYTADDRITQPRVTASCIESIRIVNLGNVRDSIVGFDTTVHYENTASLAESTGESSVYYFTTADSTREMFSDELRSVIETLEVSIHPDKTFTQEFLTSFIKFYSLEPLSFPLAIDGFSTIDIEALIIVGLAPQVHFKNSYEGPEGLSPLVVEIKFIFASGNTSETPQIQCMSVG